MTVEFFLIALGVSLAFLGGILWSYCKGCHDERAMWCNVADSFEATKCIPFLTVGKREYIVFPARAVKIEMFEEKIAGNGMYLEKTRHPA